MEQEDKKILLRAVVEATRARKEAQAEARRIIASANRIRKEARLARAATIRAADDAGVPREEIAAAAGAKWPMSRAGWSNLRLGKSGTKR